VPGDGTGCAGSMKKVPFDGGVEDIAAFRSEIFRRAFARFGSTSASSGVTTSLPTPLKANPLAWYRRTQPVRHHSIEVHSEA
jgi:hypothetical protein